MSFPPPPTTSRTLSQDCFPSFKHLDGREQEYAMAIQTQKYARARLESLESRLIVGGQSLLDKDESQACLLDNLAVKPRSQEQRNDIPRRRLRAKKGAQRQC
nr:hypothetical protein HmN_000342600 [Hymenolepis microstoma]